MIVRSDLQAVDELRIILKQLRIKYLSTTI